MPCLIPNSLRLNSLLAGPFCTLVFFFKINVFKKFFQEHHQCDKLLVHLAKVCDRLQNWQRL